MHSAAQRQYRQPLFITLLYLTNTKSKALAIVFRTISLLMYCQGLGRQSRLPSQEGLNLKPVFDVVWSRVNKAKIKQTFWFFKHHAYPYTHPPSLLLYVNCWLASDYRSKIMTPRAVQSSCTSLSTLLVVSNASHWLMTFLTITV